MITFQDIFKKSFLEGWSTYDTIGEKAFLITLSLTGLISLYIFFVYRLVTRKGFYSKNFNISLVGVSLITSAIILTIQTNVVVSLGMVGALSIVRYRTAIKEPMDLMFLFWTISVGIICGAGHAEFAALLSIVLTAGIVALDRIPDAKAPVILVVSSSKLEDEKTITETVSQYCRYYKVRARNAKPQKLELTYEIRTKDGGTLVREISQMHHILSVSMISHDGEVTF